jgi:hypothetical protein
MCHVILLHLKRWKMIIQQIRYKIKKIGAYFINLYVETKWRPHECNTCSNYELTRFDKDVSIIMNLSLIQIYK